MILRLSFFASVKLTITLMILIVICILLGAWCPQESQSGFQKVIETFGEDKAVILRNLGITDIFHSFYFLALIGLITLNMIACSFQRVFPKIKLLKMPLKLLSNSEISKIPNSFSFVLNSQNKPIFDYAYAYFKNKGYSLKQEGTSLSGDFGKVGRLAASVTHVGLLTLLLGITITSWTGFNGFQPVPLGGILNFHSSEHSKLWIGKLPTWQVRVDDTRREDYDSGDPKQWYSKLSVIDDKGKLLKQQEISVNNPLSYDGVDIYQSSWGLDSIEVAFNEKHNKLPLEQMGATHAAFVPLDERTVLIFSLRGLKKPLKIFAKIPEWKAPRLLTEISSGESAKLGQVELTYVKAIPVTGLQYKSDPGINITFLAFGVIILGVMMAAIPYNQVWVSVEMQNPKNSQNSQNPQDSQNLQNSSDSVISIVSVAGISKKGKAAFNAELNKLAGKLKDKFIEIAEHNNTNEKEESNTCQSYS